MPSIPDENGTHGKKKMKMIIETLNNDRATGVSCDNDEVHDDQ